MNRSPGTGAPRLLLPVLLLVAGLAAGCGEVVVSSQAVADLRVEGPVTITAAAGGDQTVTGTVVNSGDLTADQVQVTLTIFAADVFGQPFVFETVPNVPVFDTIHGTQTLFPGERGTFTVLFPAPRPRIVDVDVQIEARFRPDGTFFFFLFTPGIVITDGVVIIGG